MRVECLLKQDLGGDLVDPFRPPTAGHAGRRQTLLRLTAGEGFGDAPTG